MPNWGATALEVIPHLGGLDFGSVSAAFCAVAKGWVTHMQRHGAAYAGSSVTCSLLA